MSRVEVRAVTKAYNDQTILDEINLDIEHGQFVVILGPSGCGKSTLLNIIAGLETTQGGQIVIDGKDVTELEPSQRGLAMVFQSYALFPAMTVRRNLSFGMEVAKVPKAEREEKIKWVSELLQIEPYLDRRPSQLSGGQRQRVAIGRALIRSSEICLFDEPLSNLDAKLRAETRLELKALHNTLGSTMIYVTHDQVEAMTMADAVAVMRGGKVEQYAPPQQIYERPQNMFVAGFIGSPSMNFIRGTLAGKSFASGGVTLDLSAYDWAEQGYSGDAIFGVRPEDVSLYEPDSDAVAIPAKKLEVEMLGSDALCWFDCLGARISARLSPDQGRYLSDDVLLSFDTSRASIFRADTEQRI
jgi:ABC-type sugar transport systems, ATPase components